MMKKVFLIAIIFFIVLFTASAHAQTREDFAVQLVEIMNIQSDGNLSGLFHYSDWLQINKSSRESVSQAQLTGIFAPQERLFRPRQQITPTDIHTAQSGIDKFVFLSNTHQKTFGTTQTSTNRRYITIQLENGGTQNIRITTPFLSPEGITTLAEIQPNTHISLIKDVYNNPVLVWEQRYGGDANDLNNFELITIRRGSFFLYDHVYNDIIVERPEKLTLGQWINLNQRYDNFLIHAQARIMHRNRAIPREEINEYWLDLPANYIVGRNRAFSNNPLVLHVNILY